MKRESRAFWVWVISLTFVASVTVTCRELSDRPKAKDCSGAQGTGPFYTAKWDNTNITLRLPAVARPGWSPQCDSLGSVFLQYGWKDGRLKPVSGSGPEAQILVTIKDLSPQPIRRIHREDWRFAESIPHAKYPINLLPRYEWREREHPGGKQFDRTWAVRGTRNPIDDLPFTTSCETKLPIDVDRQVLTTSELFQNPDSFSFAQCRGGIEVAKGKAFAMALVDVRVPAVKDIDQIYLSLQKELETYIVED